MIASTTSSKGGPRLASSSTLHRPRRPDSLCADMPTTLLIAESSGDSSPSYSVPEREQIAPQVSRAPHTVVKRAETSCLDLWEWLLRTLQPQMIEVLSAQAESRAH